MSESSVHDQMITLAGAQDCPDDLGGILAVIDAASDSSGSLRYTDDFGMADDPEDAGSAAILWLRRASTTPPGANIIIPIL